METLKNLKKLSKVKNEISINYLDRSQGVKTGALVKLKPSFKYVMEGGAEAESFDMSDIVLIQRQKRNNEWTDVELPCFAINIKIFRYIWCPSSICNFNIFRTIF